MRDIRRKERAIKDEAELEKILLKAKYVTLAMSQNNEPYLVSLSHGYDKSRKCIYIHCARKGKKIDILKENNIVWGQALYDAGYNYSKCSHSYATTMFKGKVTFIDEFDEKKKALEVMINQLEKNPEPVMQSQMTEKAITNVTIGRIDIDYLSGKKSKGVKID